ncbi:ABC transporter permease [Swaminathania salitolerans]|uniref:Peptide ABC transporter permease n=1 Tax=Swaminathania salitolerans TaxID=182838 RepID=A0A511BRQ1_9PROT|nr:ABC transporter permease [Swaminathania salitolerans]GBQ14355.1 peptide ABC transporter permease [Swaminathania salitolerans LMG 21291]GEL03006.1 peptide ABC transporter permease [Swaminathania salitolerans]
MSLAWRGAIGRPSVLFACIVLVGLCLSACLAPFYAQGVGVDPFASNLAGSVMRDGRVVDVMQPNDNPLHLGLTPIGPSWRWGAYSLGADSQGRDVAARLLYGGRSSLLIAGASACLCLVLATGCGMVAGVFGGWIDTVLSRLLDILWAVPVYLFAISLSVVTVGHDLRFGPFHIGADSFLLPIGIIALIYVPYAARPIRARTRSLMTSGFVLAAQGLGASPVRIVLKEILPSLIDTLLVLAPLIMALCLLAESALSFLSLGVQAPAASWGSLIHDGEGLIYSRPVVAIAPGLAIVLTVLALNMLGEALQNGVRPMRTR